MANDVVLVTGASSGIGLEIAVHLAEQGFRVYATMRDPGRQAALLEEAGRRSVRLEVLPLDVTDEASIHSVVQTIVDQTGGLYGLINNAGMILRGYFEDVSDAEMRRVFATNLFGTMALTKAVLPLFRKAGRGRIVIMSSTGGRLASPGNSAYCSSKFALEGFGEALSQEMRPFGVYVSLVEPGFVKTDLFGRNRNIAVQAQTQQSAYRPSFERLEKLTDEQVQAAVTPPSAVAKTVRRLLTAKRPNLRNVVGGRARLLLALRRRLPGEAFDRIWMKMIARRVAGASEAA